MLININDQYYVVKIVRTLLTRVTTKEFLRFLNFRRQNSKIRINNIVLKTQRKHK